MKAKQLIVAIAVLAFGIFSAQTRAENRFPNKPLEDGHETSTENIILPTAVGGTLVFKGCAQCKYGVLHMTAESKFFINATPVSIGELNSFVRKGGPYFVMVYQKTDSTDLSRVVIHSSNAPVSGKK